ncbi:uncharacterized protein Z520_09977 [Fonsecaea multimorphosa CBS 102226]|uniref:C2H2-type domain-containing protein n=1 Tax=Fonsecaea multimorphosa CBS 102226 TaxID=1442371 RepID=A0A0D2JLR1_9EURO|nr:uncharacterized protein Z520_09977 [Fonsecaea multimorphosa CBS 102226]KIX94267.1 hypothetical protein Z520_09977 [Fonsecaea multimorphosa CBS 102226]OAL19948.1 hypothetical protein AYO22_09475 [Fonsecaea multimorphosa]
MVKRSRESSVLSSSSDTASSVAEESQSPRPAKLSAVATVADLPAKPVMQCSLPPHRETLDFASIEDFEVHYAKDHSNRCTSCGKNFPTAHFLALHIDENHNTFREALQAKGEKTYACFVEDCDRKCSTPQKRRLHLIDKHLFPKIYNFRIVDTGIDKSTSMLHESRRRRVSTTTDQATSSSSHRRQHSRTDNKKCSAVVAPGKGKDQERKGGPNLDFNKNVSDAAINELESSLSALRFVPPSVANRQKNKQHNV